jgi:hypothetical protein
MLSAFLLLMKTGAAISLHHLVSHDKMFLILIVAYPTAMFSGVLYFNLFLSLLAFDRKLEKTKLGIHFKFKFQF